MYGDMEVSVMIRSPDETELVTQEVAGSKQPVWDTSLICSPKERALEFVVQDVTGEGKVNALGRGTLNFNVFQYNPEKEITRMN